jgi:hypothetical protein
MNLPYAMCESIPRFNLADFGRGAMWLKVDFTYIGSAPAIAPVNLWFDAGNGLRKHLPLVMVGQIPGRQEKSFRVEEACFKPSTIFGSGCTGGDSCAHCGHDEVCGALAECGGYDLRNASLEVAAEFCGPMVGVPSGSVIVHRVELVEPNCKE